MADTKTTQLINLWITGEELHTKVYDYLNRIARHQLRKERSGHTMSTADLVNECYIKISKWPLSSQVKDRGEFWGVVSRVMKQILVNHAKAKKADKRGGGQANVTLNDKVAGSIFSQNALEEILSLDKGLAALSREDARAADVAERLYFAGCTHKQVAEALGISESTVQRDWDKAKAWLKLYISEIKSDTR